MAVVGAGAVFCSQKLRLSSINHYALIIGLYSVMSRGLFGSSDSALAPSFTLGEASIVAQMITLVIVDCALLWASPTTKEGRPGHEIVNPMAWPTAGARSDLSLVIEFGLAGTLCILIFLGPVVLATYKRFASSQAVAEQVRGQGST